MSIALVDFYPLAGLLSTVKYDDDQSSLVYVDPEKGPGAILIHASGTEEYKVTVNDIVTCYENSSRNIWSFFDMGELGVVNYDGHTRPLLSVQVTNLVDGVFLGFTMNHALGDGISIFHFIKVLSKVFMGQGAEIEKPIFKAMFADGYGPVLKLPYSESESITRFDVDPNLKLRVFHFSGETIARLKAQVNSNSNSNNNNNNNNTISSFQALAAFMWLSITRVQNLPGESNMHCLLIADTRPNLGTLFN
ncbi:putative acetyltransferase At3g50280 [Silene latifolia]|uniref:putative acetyltransferase At3g50280 n=1 Tax=Silene latifolia TaxID=37657 RepID=UPI003D777781